MANYRFEVVSNENLANLVSLLESHGNVKKVEQTNFKLPMESRDDWWDSLFIEEESSEYHSDKIKRRNDEI